MESMHTRGGEEKHGREQVRAGGNGGQTRLTRQLLCPALMRPCAHLLSIFVTVGGSHLLLALLQELHLLVNLLNGVLQSLQLHLQRLQVVLCKTKKMKRNTVPCNRNRCMNPNA